MTREQLINRIKAKMDVDVNDTSQDYYSGFYDGLIDECLNIVANTVLPYQNKIEIFYGGEIEDSTSLDSNKYYKIKTSNDSFVLNGERTSVKKGD